MAGKGREGKGREGRKRTDERLAPKEKKTEEESEPRKSCTNGAKTSSIAWTLIFPQAIDDMFQRRGRTLVTQKFVVSSATVK